MRPRWGGESEEPMHVKKGRRCLGSLALLGLLLAGPSLAHARAHPPLPSWALFQLLPDLLVENHPGALKQAAKLGGKVKRRYDHFTALSYPSVEEAGKAAAALRLRYTAELDIQLPAVEPSEPQPQWVRIRAFGG